MTIILEKGAEDAFMRRYNTPFQTNDAGNVKASDDPSR